PEDVESSVNRFSNCVPPAVPSLRQRSYSPESPPWTSTKNSWLPTPVKSITGDESPESIVVTAEVPPGVPSVLQSDCTPAASWAMKYPNPPITTTEASP